MFGPPGQRGPLLFITLTVLLDTMGFGLIVPVLPTLVSDLGNVPLDEAAIIGGMLIMTYALAQFLFSPVVGGLSDAYGRRPLLLLSMAGFAANMLVMALAPVLWMFFVGRALSGISGASYTTAYAFIADVTPQERRAETFGLVGVAFGLGFIIGPALGGLLGAENVRLPFFVAAGLAGANLLLGYFLLPESLPKDRRRPFDWRRANPVGSLKQISRLGGPLRRLAATYFLWMLAIQSLHGIWSYVAAYRYEWTPSGIGVSLALVGVLAVVVNGFLVRRSVKIFGEWQTAVIGLSAGTLGYGLHVLADHSWLAYAAITVGALGGLTVPALQAMMTARADTSQQGELQGGLATLSSLTVIAGPVIFSQIFAHFSGDDAAIHTPGAPFVLAMMLAGMALLMMFRNERTSGAAGS